MLRRLHPAPIVCVAFLAGNLVNALTKGGDFEAYLGAARRLLAGNPLYEGSAIAQGFVGPPAQSVLFVPLAALERVPAGLAWYAISLALLGYATATWMRLLCGPDDASAPPAGWSWKAPRTRIAVLSLAGIAYPLQAQFEHQNLNLVLLALMAYAASAFRRGRPTLGGAALGLAAAIKVYPLLVLGWVMLRAQWRALAAAVVVVSSVSVVPAVFRGLDGLRTDAVAWWTLAGSGWPTRRANQSLAAMWGRYVLGEGPEGYPILTSDQPAVLVLAGATALVVVVPLALAWARHHAAAERLPSELACVHALSVLLSPIAWEHYWVAFHPVFLVLGSRAWSTVSHPARRPRGRVAPDPIGFLAAGAFWIGVAGLTLLSRPLVGWEGARLVRSWSFMTWAGLVLCATLAVLLAQRRANAGSLQ